MWEPRRPTTLWASTTCYRDSFTFLLTHGTTIWILTALKTLQRFLYAFGNVWSRDSSVGIVTGYGMDDRGVGVRVPVGSRIVPSPRRPDRFWGPPSLLFNGHGRLSPWIKRPGRETDNSLQLVPKSRIRGSIHPLPHTPSWRSAQLVKHRDNFIFFGDVFLCSLTTNFTHTNSSYLY
jgi:hypothetical protein